MANYREIARRKARKYGLRPEFFEAQIGAESNFDPHARSGAGALGIAQIMPATARGWGVNPNHPRQALDAAAKNMASYVKQYGSEEAALRAYNAGPGNIAKSRGFGETNAYVKKILGSAGKGGGGGRTSAGTPGTPGHIELKTTTGVDEDGAYLDALMSRKGKIGKLGSGSLLKDVDRRLSSGSYNTSTSTPEIVGGSPGTPGGALAGASGNSSLDAIVARANKIDKAQLPYVYGGGHGSAKLITPMDCSAAVSRALGIDTRVSGALASWGKPGEGKTVTIYANAEHVLMKINGHFWGTSGSNPKGGAGWIPASAITKQYLSKFTARHPAGL